MQFENAKHYISNEPQNSKTSYSLKTNFDTMNTINLRKTREIKDAITETPSKVKDITDQESELGICITDSKGYFVSVNQRYCDIYDWQASELIGKHFTEVVPAQHKDQLKRMHDAFIENQYEIIRNWEVQKKDQSKIKIQADAGWNDRIFDGNPHKITFVHVM